MVETGHGAKVEDAAEGAGAGVRGREDHPRDPGLHDGPGAHRAGLQGHEELRPGKTVVARRPGRRPQRLDLRVRRRVACPDGPVPSRPELDAAPHHHRPDRNLALARGAVGELERPTHPVLVVAHSHSMVAGGLLVTSTPTREIPGTSLTMRVDTVSRSSQGRRAARAVMKSAVSTARRTTTGSCRR